MQVLIEERSLIDSILPLDDLLDSLSAEADIYRMTEWIDQVADFQVATKHFAAVAPILPSPQTQESSGITVYPRLI